MGNSFTLAGTGYDGGGFKGNGKLVHKPREAHPSSSVKDNSCAVSGFLGFPEVPATDGD